LIAAGAAGAILGDASRRHTASTSGRRRLRLALLPLPPLLLLLLMLVPPGIRLRCRGRPPGLAPLALLRALQAAQRPQGSADHAPIHPLPPLVDQAGHVSGAPDAAGVGQVGD
jgi:hypothetical protein